MKKEKNNNKKPVTRGDMVKVVQAIVSKSQEELALIMAKSIAEVHGDIKDVSKKIDEVDNRLILTKEELTRKIDGVEVGLNTKIDTVSNKVSGTNARIDELAFNRVKYEDHQKLVERVDKLERNQEKKGKIGK